MFLRTFKEYSNRKYLNKLLSNRYVNVDDNKVESLGIIFNMDENEDFNLFKNLVSKLKIHANNFKVIGFSKDKKTSLNTWDLCFNPDDFGWKGEVKNAELQTF